MTNSVSNARRFDYLRIVGRCYLERLEATMSDAPPLVRQWTLLRILSARHYGATVKEMAAETGVSEKTIRRDLELFVQVGFPLEELSTERGRKTWRLDPARSQPGLSFAFDEAIALYLGRRLLDPLAGTPFWEAAQRAFKKVRASLTPKALKYVESFGAVFHQTLVGSSDYSRKTEIVDQLMVGIEDRLAVFITYQSLRATEPVTYDIYPYGLVFHRGSLYLVGVAPDCGEIRHWKVNRIEDAEVTQVHFQRPADFDLVAHLSKSFGVYHADGPGEVSVRVRFSPQVARYVAESQWHHTQQLTPDRDGSIVAQFHLSDTEEIRHWIMSFGRHAEVIEPEELRREIVAELEQMAHAYQSKDTTPIRREPR